MIGHQAISMDSKVSITGFGAKKISQPLANPRVGECFVAFVATDGHEIKSVAEITEFWQPDVFVEIGARCHR